MIVMKRILLAMALSTPLFCSNIANSVEGETQIVYICTGPQSKVYHKHSDCKGLRSCSKDIRKVTLDKAKSMKRRACKWCY